MKPLYDKICEYVAKNPARFHMPAHFGTGDNPLFSSAKYDVTELDFSDNLQNPTGAILESEKECAKTYGAKNCFYLTSGSTTGVFIAMCAMRNRTDEIIVARSSHKSVYAAARTLGFKVRYIPSSFDKNGIPLPVMEKDVVCGRVRHNVTELLRHDGGRKKYIRACEKTWQNSFRRRGARRAFPVFRTL